MKKIKIKRISVAEFDRKAEAGEDLSDHMNWKKAQVFNVQRVNVDFPQWMIDRLDHEATRLNISRQAIIKMWINDRLSHR